MAFSDSDPSKISLGSVNDKVNYLTALNFKESAFVTVRMIGLVQMYRGKGLGDAYRMGDVRTRGRIYCYDLLIKSLPNILLTSLFRHSNCQLPA